MTNWYNPFSPARVPGSTVRKGTTSLFVPPRVDVNSQAHNPTMNSAHNHTFDSRCRDINCNCNTSESNNIITDLCTQDSVSNVHNTEHSYNFMLHRSNTSLFSNTQQLYSYMSDILNLDRCRGLLMHRCVNLPPSSRQDNHTPCCS